MSCRLRPRMKDSPLSSNLAAGVQRITCPVLIVHGDADELVPVKEAHELHGCLNHLKHLLVLRGGDHRLSNPAIMQRAIAEALDWLTKHVQ